MIHTTACDFVSKSKCAWLLGSYTLPQMYFHFECRYYYYCLDKLAHVHIVYGTIIYLKLYCLQVARVHMEK